MIKRFTLFALTCILFFSLSMVSCKKFSGQAVPAYIHIDSVSLACDYYTYGANTSNFTDAWVYVDDQILGCFELPATFPILKKGPHKVSVYAGISVNGVGASRSYYPFCQPQVYEDLVLVEDSIITLNPVVSYYPINEGVKVGWMEDFETGCSLESLAESDTSIMRVSGNEAWQSVNSFYSAKLALPPDSLDFYVAMTDEMTFHSDLQGDFCMLEMDYNCNDTFFVGLMYYKDYTITRWPMLKVLPTDKTHLVPEKWKKIYVNLGHYMTANETASYFKLYFTSDLSVNSDYEQHDYTPINEERYYYIDNLKVLHR